MNLAIQMIRAGTEHGECPSIVQGKTILYRYRETADRVARIAAGLSNRYKLKPGDRVALISSNCPEYLELLYAVWHAGMVVVPINAKLHQNEFNYILRNSQARLCFVSQTLQYLTASLKAEGLESVIEIASDEYLKLKENAPGQLYPSAPDDIAWLFYTSGTTGKAKGAMLSHKNLFAMCDCYFSDVDPVAPWTSILHAAPMSHGSGLYALAYVSKGGSHIIPESSRFDAREIYRLIEYWPGIAFFAAPTMVKRLLDYTGDADTRHLKAIIYGGGPMYLEDCLAGLERFGPKLTQLYGQGESPMTITALNAAQHAEKKHPRWLKRLSSVGTAQFAVELRIADAQDKQLEPGDVGEILVRGDTVMKGYWRNPQATDEALRNGWLHTGDYGVLDEDSFLTLKDRVKDLIISGGSNIYPREVEEILLQHPDVYEVSVIGRADREWGEIVIAYIVANDSHDIDTKNLDSYCKQKIARYKRPRFYHQVDTLPKNNYGKVLKTELRRLDLERPASR